MRSWSPYSSTTRIIHSIFYGARTTETISNAAIAFQQGLQIFSGSYNVLRIKSWPKLSTRCTNGFPIWIQSMMFVVPILGLKGGWKKSQTPIPRTCQLPSIEHCRGVFQGIPIQKKADELLPKSVKGDSRRWSNFVNALCHPTSNEDIRWRRSYKW